MRGESLGEILTRARQKKLWTLEEAAEALGVSVSTVERWEKGLTRPQGYHLRRICEVYGLTPETLGIHGESVPVAIPISEKLRSMAMSDLTIRLSILATSTHRSLYEVQHELRRTLEESVKDDDITRREALRRLTWLPLLGVLAGNATPVGGGDIMNQYAAGITACWELSKGDGYDITLAYEQINTYLAQLSGYLQAANSTAQRKAALTLIAQCYHFKTIMGFHVESLPAARGYAYQALHYSTLADDVPLQIEVIVRLAWIYYYDKQYQQAYTEISNVVAKLEATKTPLPHLLVSSVYSTNAIMQAVCHQKQPALLSLGLAQEHFTVSDNDEPGCHIDHGFASHVLEDGLTYAHLGMLDKAQDALNQLANKASSWERVRIEAYNSQVLALLKSPGKDLEQTVSLWSTAIRGATTLKSERRWQEAMENYSIMQAIWPGERRIEELQDLAIHW